MNFFYSKSGILCSPFHIHHSTFSIQHSAFVQPMLNSHAQLMFDHMQRWKYFAIAIAEKIGRIVRKLVSIGLLLRSYESDKLWKYSNENSNRCGSARLESTKYIAQVCMFSSFQMVWNILSHSDWILNYNWKYSTLSLSLFLWCFTFNSLNDSYNIDAETSANTSPTNRHSGVVGI